MLNNPLGVYLYLICRNDISWSLLKSQEKDNVLKANKFHNVERDDYKNPEKYGAGRFEGGENWDSFNLKKNDYRGQVLDQTLKKKNPIRVLEIGPGAGFYSRLICEHSSVEYYTAIDINRSFLDYLSPRLEKFKTHKNFSYDFICDNFTDVEFKEKYDMIVLLSAVHHIPDRFTLFAKTNTLLKDDGIIFCFDPSHYLIRIIRLTVKCFKNGYLKKKFYSDKKSLATHHMCSAGEYRKICKSTSLIFENIYYKVPNKLSIFKNTLFRSLFSTEIGVVLKKGDA